MTGRRSSNPMYRVVYWSGIMLFVVWTAFSAYSVLKL
jgi:hypothetical protein